MLPFAHHPEGKKTELIFVAQEASFSKADAGRQFWLLGCLCEQQGYLPSCQGLTSAAALSRTLFQHCFDIQAAITVRAAVLS